MKNKYLLYKQEISDTLKLALPVIIGQLSIVLMGLIDTIQVGKMKNNAAISLAAGGMANSIFITIAIIGYIAFQAISPMVSKALAEKNILLCRQLLTASIRVSLLLSLFCIIIIVGIASQYHLFKQSAANEYYAKPFLYIITISIIPSFLFSAIRSFSDGLSKTSIAMYITVIALLLNIGLNYVLIEGRFGFPALGLNGAGISTLLARCFMAICIALYVYKGKEFSIFFKEKPTPKISPLVIKIIKIGVPSGLQGFFEIATFGMAVVMMGWISTSAQASHIVAISMVSLTYMAASGLSVAGGIRVGSAIGHKSKTMLYLAGNTSFFLVSIFMSLSALVFFFGNEYLVRLYTSEEKVIEIAVQLVVWGAFFQLFDGVQAVGLGVLRGIQDINIPTLITIFSYWGVGIPMSYFFAFNANLGAEGIWIGLSLSLIVSSILLTWRFYDRIKKIIIP